MKNNKSFLVSSPGKVILFGEHAVVYNKPAIGASVGVRQYLLVSPIGETSLIELDFPDVGFSQTWKVRDLPWSLLNEEHKAAELHDSKHEHELHTGVEKALNALIKEVDGELGHAAHSAAFAFLYLYLHLCSSESEGRRYSVRSLIPVSAGLGSSAAFSVCLSTALMLVEDKIKDPSDSSAEQKIKTINMISKWSYVAEVCIHGAPSGIDNAVATRGGAVFFQRPNTLIPYDRFPQLKLVLTDTKQPKSTAKLVANVRLLKEKFPAIVDPILDSIAEISTRAGELIKSAPATTSPGEYSADLRNISHELSSLIHINHALLNALGVGHASLEKVKTASDELQLGETKLTGAGGGGCAITLVDYEGYHKSITEHDRKVDLLRQALPEEYRVFESILGGPGVGFGEIRQPVNWRNFVKLNSRHEFEDLATWSYWN